MTEKQYNTFMNSRFKLYKIWLDVDTIKKRIVKRDSICIDWINSRNIYDYCSKRICRYVTENKLNEQILKFLKELYEDYETQVNHLLRKQLKVSAVFNYYS